MKELLTMRMKDGTVWGVPVMEIAENRAAHYASEFGGNLQDSLAEDTLPLFESDTYEIKDWAVNQMNWSDFKAPRLVKAASPLTAQDFEDAWMNTSKELL